MKINFANEFAGIVIELSPSQRILLYGDDVRVNLIENPHGSVGPLMPDGLIIELVLGLGATKELVEHGPGFLPFREGYHENLRKLCTKV